MTWKVFATGEGKKSKGPCTMCCLTCAVNLAVRAVKLALLPRANCAGSAVRRQQADIIVCGKRRTQTCTNKVFLKSLSTRPMRKKSAETDAGSRLHKRDYTDEKNIGYLTCKQSGKLQNTKPRYSW